MNLENLENLCLEYTEEERGYIVGLAASLLSALAVVGFFCLLTVWSLSEPSPGGFTNFVGKVGIWGVLLIGLLQGAWLVPALRWAHANKRMELLYGLAAGGAVVIISYLFR